MTPTSGTGPAAGRIPAPIGRRIAWLVRGIGPATAWLAAAAVCGGLLWMDSRTYSARGVVHGPKASVSAPVAGVLVEVRPAFLDRVHAQQVVALLDASAVEAEVEVLRAESRALAAEFEVELARLRAESASLAASGREEARRLAVDLATAEIEVLDRRVALETTRIELSRRELERERALRLEELGFETELSLDIIEARIEELAASAEGQRVSLSAAERDAASARARALEAPGVAEAFGAEAAIAGAFERRAEVLAARVALAEQGLSNCVLRAPRDGIVGSVLARSGEAVMAGQLLLEVVPESSSEVIAYLAEHEPRRPRPGDAAKVRTGDRRVLAGTVAVVGPSPLPKPARMQRRAALPEFGIPVLVRLDGGQSLPADAVVQVAFRN